LRTALQDVLDGSGRLIFLTGEPGIGKTRLAEELARHASARGAEVAWGRCWEEEGAPDLWPWLQVIRSCLRSLDDDTLRELVGPHGGGLTALVAPLRARRSDVEAHPPDSAKARFRLFNAIAHFLDGYAERMPLVVILDDLHRADAESLLLLRFFTQEQRQRRMLLIGTYRDPGAPPNRALMQAVVEAMREPGTERLVLGGLSEAATRELLESFLGQSASAALVETVQVRTGGNPLFLTECARLLAAREQAGGMLAASASDLPLNGVLRESIEQRLAPLSPAHRQALAVAAHLGREIDCDALCELPDKAGLAELDRETATAALAAAEQLGIVVRGGPAGAQRFAHDLVRELLAEAAPDGMRAAVRECAAPAVASSGERQQCPAFSVSVLRKEGAYWIITYAGRTCRVRDAKGLTYVAALLRYPGKPRHVTELVTLDAASDEPVAHRDDGIPVRADLGDAGVVLDDEAKASYRRRLEELRSELDEAESFHDSGRAARVQEEIEFLSRELAAAIGLGGRDRRVGSHTERARVNVSRSIARAIEKIGENHPELARHLGRSIRTGTFCTYVGDPTEPTTWEL
jgi:hypothetical protein